MKDIMKLALRLIIITAAAGLLLGLTYNATKEPIAYQEELSKSEARMAVLSQATDFEEFDLTAVSLEDAYADITEVYIGLNDGQTVGATISFDTTGYSSGLNLTVGIAQDGTIAGVDIVSHGETPGLGAKADDAEYLAQYIGKSVELSVVKTEPSADSQIQAVTGATITSSAIADAVNAAQQFYQEYLAKGV